MQCRASESSMPAPHSQFHTIFKKFIRMKIAFQVVWAVNGRENIRETKCVAFAYLMHISREWWKCCCKKLPVLKHTHTHGCGRAHTRTVRKWTIERTKKWMSNTELIHMVCTQNDRHLCPSRCFPVFLAFRMQFCTYIWKSHRGFFSLLISKCIFHTISSVFSYFLLFFAL